MPRQEKGTKMTNPYPGEFRMGALKDLLRLNLTDTVVDNEIVPQVEAAMEQARRDAFDLMRDIFRENWEADRWTFINYCLTGAMEGHTFWFQRVRYDIGHEPDFYPKGVDVRKDRRPASATIIEPGGDDYDYLDREAVEKVLAEGSEDTPAFEITHETIEKGLALIRNAVNVPDTGTGNWERGLTSIPHLGQGMRNEIIRADLTNDASILDADGYSVILEVALFGEVRYV